MKVVIDARMYGLPVGIGRYIANLVGEIKNAMLALPCQQAGGRQEKLKIKNWQVVLLVRKEKLSELRKELGDEFRLIICEAPHYSFKEQIVLPIQLFKLKPDLVHFPHFNVPVFWWGKQVVTIHDLIKHESRGKETTTREPFLYWFKYLNYRFLVWLAVKRAARVIVPSRFWQKELIKRYKLPKDKVIVTYEGVTDKFKQLNNRTIELSALPAGRSNNLLSKYRVKKPFIIYTGSLYPHKNVERLVQALKKINISFTDTPVYQQKKLSLVIVCGRSVFYERFKRKIKELKADKFVNLVGFVPDEELAVLYSQAKAFVLPSLWEGFGLIGLEAMACGLPVVASRASCLPEIYGKAALYFDPLDVDDMAKKVKRVVSDTALSAKLKKKGFEQVKKYSWRKMARKTLAVYESVL